MSKKWGEFVLLSEKIIKLSDNIMKLYYRLSFVEIEKGKESQEYNKILLAIQMSLELEEELLNEIKKDYEVLLFFNDYISMNNCRRLEEKAKNEQDFAQSIFFAIANDNYDKMAEKKEIKISKKDYLKKEYEERGSQNIRRIACNLKSAKTYIKLLEDYIEHTDDMNVRSALICEKNITLSENKALESWYFGFANDIDALIIESDELISSGLEMPLENYKNYRNNFYLEACDIATQSTLKDQINYPEEKIINELRFLSYLLSMDAETMEMSYKLFQDEVEDDPYSYDKKYIEYVDSIYGKTASLTKRINNK